MNLPTIAIDMIPALDGAQALFGAVLNAGGPDDRIVDIMVYIYEIIPPETTVF